MLPIAENVKRSTHAACQGKAAEFGVMDKRWHRGIDAMVVYNSPQIRGLLLMSITQCFYEDVFGDNHNDFKRQINFGNYFNITYQLRFSQESFQRLLLYLPQFSWLGL